MATEPTAGVVLARLGQWSKILMETVRPSIDTRFIIATLIGDAEYVIREQSDMIARQQDLIAELQRDLATPQEEPPCW